MSATAEMTTQAKKEEVRIPDNGLQVLRKRYLKKNEKGQCVEEPKDMFWRVAHAVAQGERPYIKDSDRRTADEIALPYYNMMVTGKFLPNSPTLMNAGRELGVLSGCFVLPFGDSIDEIMDCAKNTAMVQRAGGGTGFCIDRLRPTGDFIKSSGGKTSGPLSFWKILAETTTAIQQGAFRRGANMMMCEVSHPDILKFIFAKQDLTQFQNYNISVKVTDRWMDNVHLAPNSPLYVTNKRTGVQYVIPKQFKREDITIHNYELEDLIAFSASGCVATSAAKSEDTLTTFNNVPVWTNKDLWDTIVKNAWLTGEPGVVFIDKINKAHPLPDIIEATNPCGEQPLLPYESCNLGSINLGLFVHSTSMVFEGDGVDWDGLRETIHLSTRFLENVVETNDYIIPQIDKVCRANRKIGLGVMGFADALYKLGVQYNSELGVQWGERFMKFVNDEAHAASAILADERGCFSNWATSKWAEKSLKQRNACSTTVAPTGTISIIANCSSGCEPLFSLAFMRQVMPDNTGKLVKMTEVNEVFKAVAKANNFWGYASDALFTRILEEGTIAYIDGIPQAIKDIFVCAHDIQPEWHVRMQAAFQRHCDSSISKTVNFSENATVEDVRKIYEMAYDSDCKGVTVYRNNCRSFQPMSLKAKAETPKAVITADEAKANFDKLVPQAIKNMVMNVFMPFMLGKVTDAEVRAEVLEAFGVPKLFKPVKTPDVLSSIRIRQNTPFGHMHINITVDPRSGRELEIFAQLGKGGEIAAADLEAICRMTSLFMRSGGTVEEVINQLDGIGTTLTIPTKDGRVSSLGDGLAKSLQKYLNLKQIHGLDALLLGRIDPSTEPIPATVTRKENLTRVNVDQQYKLKCPECHVGTLAHEENCQKCQSCGYSKCG